MGPMGIWSFGEKALALPALLALLALIVLIALFALLTLFAFLALLRQGPAAPPPVDEGPAQSPTPRSCCPPTSCCSTTSRSTPCPPPPTEVPLDGGRAEVKNHLPLRCKPKVLPQDHDTRPPPAVLPLSAPRPSLPPRSHSPGATPRLRPSRYMVPAYSRFQLYSNLLLHTGRTDA